MNTGGRHYFCASVVWSTAPAKVCGAWKQKQFIPIRTMRTVSMASAVFGLTPLPLAISSSSLSALYPE